MISTGQPSVEVLIPARGGSEQAGDAIANASQLGPVRLLDSFASDGASLFDQGFVDDVRRQEAGAEESGSNQRWVFVLGPDERITPALRDEMLASIGRGTASGYYVKRQLIFMGREIGHGGCDSRSLRLFRRGAPLSGRAGFLHGRILHVQDGAIAQLIQKQICSADLKSDRWMSRRRNLRARLPFRPLWRFCWMYIIRLGFLDGAAGWHLACLAACDEYMKALLHDEKMAVDEQ